MAHGDSQARGLIRAVATGLHQSHSNSGSTPGLRPTPKPQHRRIRATTATCTPAHSNTRSLTHWARPGIEPVSLWILVRFVSIEPRWELHKSSFIWFIYLCIFFVFSRAAPVASGDSQARGLIRAVATGLGQSHSNEGSELCLRPTPQLMATKGTPYFVFN